jgi:PilZ domain
VGRTLLSRLALSRNCHGFIGPKVTSRCHYRGKLTLPPPVASFSLENRQRIGTILKEDISKASPERQKKRIQLALPIRVTYWDDTQKPCLEIACTYDISEHGARVTGLRCVKEAGEVIAIERGKNKAFCRVVWVGEPNSELAGQIGLQSVESDRTLWEAELKDMVEVYEPVLPDGNAKRRTFASHERRRRRERFSLEGTAELVEQGPHTFKADVVLKNMSEIGCLVLTKHMVPAGTELKVTLHVHDHNLTLKGQVKHSEPQVGLGIEFREICKGERQILQFLIRKLAEKHFEETLQFEIHK